MAADLRTAELMLIDRRLRESADMSATKPIRSDRLMLTPLDAADAGEMVAVLSDRDLYTFMGGESPTLEQLQELYRGQSAGSPGPTKPGTTV